MTQHNSHVWAYQVALFTACLVQADRALNEAMRQLAVSLKEEARRRQANAAAHLADVIRNGT